MEHAQQTQAPTQQQQGQAPAQGQQQAAPVFTDYASI